MPDILLQRGRRPRPGAFAAAPVGDRVFLMAPNPGRLIEILKVPRPAEPPEESRRKPWFVNFCQGLLRRLEEESPAPQGVKV